MRDGPRGIQHSEAGDHRLTLPYVLIVEDDQALAKLLDELFRIVGLRCFTIRSKLSAEQFLRHVRPDLVVLDYHLIGGLGLKAAQIASNMKVPVIVTSGYLDICERVREAGYFYLGKPFAPSELLALTSNILGVDLSLPRNPPIDLTGMKSEPRFQPGWAAPQRGPASASHLGGPPFTGGARDPLYPRQSVLYRREECILIPHPLSGAPQHDAFCRDCSDFVEGRQGRKGSNYRRAKLDEHRMVCRLDEHETAVHDSMVN
jgi:CheY-like chemotaxis protein